MVEILALTQMAFCRVAQGTLCETARRSEDRLQDHAAVRDERHEEAQHATQDDGRGLVVLNVHPDEHEALGRQDRGSEDR